MASAEGRPTGELDPMPVELTALDAERYADLVMDGKEMYRTTSRQGRQVCHPGLLAELYLWPVLTTGLGRYSVHAQAYNAFLAPVHAGQVLSVLTRIAGSYDRRGRRHGVMEGVVRDDRGKAVLRFRNIGVSMAPELTPDESAALTDAVPFADEAEMRSLEVAMGETAGEEIPGLERVAKMAPALREFSTEASPHEDETARSMGYGAAIIGGATVQAYVLDMLVSFFGETWLRHGRLFAKFIAGVPEGEPLRVRGRIAGRAEAESADQLRLSVWVEDSGSRKVLVGGASCLVHERNRGSPQRP